MYKELFINNKKVAEINFLYENEFDLSYHHMMNDLATLAKLLKFHNDKNEPSLILYDYLERVSSKHYYKNGNLHNAHGPAIILYYYNSDDQVPVITHNSYYFNNNLINVYSDEEYRKYQNNLNLQ